MKNITKRIIAVFAVLAVAAMNFTGCSIRTNSNQSENNISNADELEVDSSAPMQYPFVVGSAADGNGLTPADPNADLYGADPVANSSSSSGNNSSSSDSESSSGNSSSDNNSNKNGNNKDDKNDKNEPATEIVEVTEANGQPATKIVVVTEPSGQKVTDANGQDVTEVVKVTEIVTKPAKNDNNDTETTKAPDNSEESNSSESSGDNNSNNDDNSNDNNDNNNNNDNQPEISNYTPKDDGRYAMWLDISKDENFFFEGDMIKASFKVKEGIPDGDYKVKISPDLSDVAGVAIYPEKVIDGVIRVNNGAIEAVDVSSESGMVFYGDKIACKQGDTIDFNINIKNNSGLVAFCIWFYFDSNALEFIEANPSGEFAQISRQTDIGGGNNN